MYKCDFILRFCSDKEVASQATENVNSVYGLDSITAYHLQFWFHRYCSGNVDVKNAPCSGNRSVRPPYKHCFDCPGAKHCIKKIWS